MKKSYTIRDLPASERPRERLAAHGAQALSLQELLAILLGRGVAGEPVLNTAQKLLSEFGSLELLLNASLEDIQKIKGIGFAKACQIKACLEIARRSLSIEEKRKSKSLLSPKEVYKILKPKIGNYKKEHFVVVSFDTRNKLIGIDTIAIGVLNATIVHPRETFEAAIRRHAARIIIAHNHPSGDPQPSDEDIKITRKLFEAGKLMDIHLLDHIIVTKNTFFTLKGDNLF